MTIILTGFPPEACGNDEQEKGVYGQTPNILFEPLRLCSELFQYYRGVPVKGVGPDSKGKEIGIVFFQVLHIIEPLIDQ